MAGVVDAEYSAAREPCGPHNFSRFDGSFALDNKSHLDGTLIKDCRGAGRHPALLWRAAERLGVMPDAVVASGTDGLLSLDERITLDGMPTLRRGGLLAPADVGDADHDHSSSPVATVIGSTTPATRWAP